MEEDQDLKYFCKLCDKKYPCGKSFGGHMRSHVLAKEKVEFKQKKLQSWIDGGKNSSKKDHKSQFELSEHSGYGLRDNPKKTWRASDSRSPLLSQENVCQQCGKVFQSLKALCGHMACHSGKDRGGSKDDHSWTSENKNLLMDSNSDTEADEPKLKSRSNTKRYNRLVAKSSSFCLVNNRSVSSPVSEIDEQEEEVAKCLMMLSMDSGIWNGVNSVVESSDNNSVILETKSSSVDMKVARKGCLKPAENVDETHRRCKKEADRNLKLNALNAEAESENSDSGYFLGEYMKVESDASVDEFHRNVNYQWNTSNKSLRVWCDETRRDVEKGFNRTTTKYITEMRNGSTKDYKYESYGMASNLAKSESRKRIKDISYEPELGKESSFRKIKVGFKGPEGSKHTRKKKKYECFNCKKAFSSYQALGGHRPCNKKANAYFESTYETDENGRGAENGPSYIDKGKHRETFNNRKPTVHDGQDVNYNPEKKMKPKKFKGHECPFCNRMFKSGQALGGHKRSHFLVGSQENHNQASVVKGSEFADLLDLNLPAPVEDMNGEPTFVHW